MAASPTHPTPVLLLAVHSGLVAALREADAGRRGVAALREANAWREEEGRGGRDGEGEFFSGAVAGDCHQGDVEDEHLAAASTAGKAMAMMLCLQKEKDEVQMELRWFAAKIDHLRALITVEEQDAKAEEEIFRSAGRTLLPYKEEQLANQLHRKHRRAASS
ncbi:hypothetical protein D1007_26671 [Hordeum vulgare]|nr:hypothetical protein D1007_26671 [Hordeum vulgare]